MTYLHGHAACLDGGCPMFGLNQAECCDGATAATCPSPMGGAGEGRSGPSPPDGTRTWPRRSIG